MAIRARTPPLAITRTGPVEFTELPVEIVMLICAVCHPKTLLMLARTSKPMRETLMTRLNSHIWKNARLAIGLDLPKIWDPLPEALLAHFMFEDVCQDVDCDGEALEKVYGLGGIRYCRRCLLRNFLCMREVNTKYTQPFPQTILNVLVVNQMTVISARKRLKLKKKYGWKKFFGKGPNVYHDPELELVRERIDAGDPEADIIADLRADASRRQILMQTLMEWDYNEKRNDKTVSGHRKNDIELKILGKNKQWTKDDLPKDNAQWLEFINKPHQLTRTEFRENRKMLEEIIAEDLRTRPERERIQSRSIARHAILVHNIAHEKQPTRFVPLTGDLCMEEGECLE